MAVDGGKRITNSGGNLTDAAVRLVIDAVNNAFSGGASGPTDAQERVLIANGYTRTQRGRSVIWTTPDGQQISNPQARIEARNINRAPPPPVQPGISIPAAPLPPAITGVLTAADKIAKFPGAGAVIRGAIAPAIAAVLLYPTAAGLGSDLRDLYGVPKPKARPGARPRRGRRTRVRARPRPVGIPGVHSPSGAVPKKGPRAITRPVVRPGSQVIQNIERRYPIKPPAGAIKLPPPPKVQPTIGQRIGTAARVVAPYVANIAGSYALSLLNPPRAGSRVGLPAISPPAIAPPTIAPPQLGTITLPGQGVNPFPQTSLAVQPLTAFNTAVAQSPAQELDDQCRARARQKRKKRKPKDRTVCYRGTFTEGKKRTSKRRKEKIPCR